jgi:hypothetical protein
MPTRHWPAAAEIRNSILRVPKSFGTDRGENKMKRFACAALLLAGTALAHPAFAEKWVTPNNGTVSTVMMPDGDVMMKIQMPAAEFNAMTTAMHNGQSCKIEHIYPDALNTMILVCRAN